jgi:hypothetical protein
MKYAWIIALFSSLWSACGDRVTLPVKNLEAEQYAYFPLEIGKYVEYVADSIVYDFSPGGTVQDTSRTWVRLVVSDTFLNQTGDQVYLIERYERKDPVNPWEIKQIDAAVRTEQQALYTENNQRFLKMVFPMDKRSFWNGNIFIDVFQEIEIAGERIRPFANWEYEVDSIDVPSKYGAFSFDSTLVITEADETNIIERRYSKAVYAKHIGLVAREQWILDSQYCNQNPSPADCTTRPWEIKAEKGYILRQSIIDHN